ncbi:AI-2E family transporter [Granulicella sp. WH15]|uniref:AI-2E family transporter n=1 Tax=Granulicella sp. WH15 TaxID=2602070 RepID=UPI00136706CD|nr:AI-2E family transporter [Granulicella sp. WH15]QHN03387.1 AI-2E family transporter [Granulicella sp. WH15]
MPDPTQPRKDTRGNILFFFGVLILLLLAYHLAKELEILYVSALFAVVLMPVLHRITSWSIRGYHPSRAIAIVLLLLAAALGLILFFTIGLPPVLNDLRGFMTDLPGRIPGAVDRLKHIPLADKLGVETIASRAENTAAALGSYIFTSLPDWLTHVFDILTTIFLCIYFMLEGEHAYEFFLSLFRPPARQRLDATLRKAELKMSKWLLGQGLLMLTLGVCSLTAFGILHVRYFVLLGVLMGLFNIIPVAGGVITIAMAAGVAAIDSWQKMFGVLIFYLIYVNLENAILTPRIMRSSVNLMGLTVLVALLLGTALGGIVGALVAVPTAALISVLLEEYAVQRPSQS